MKLLVLLALAACTVDRKSETVACTTTADCTESNHTCENGYCVKLSQSDCPDHCDTCNTDQTPHQCFVTNTGGDSFDCPSGFVCLLSCGGDGSRSMCGTITCDTNSACVISCDGASSCGDIHCDNACECDMACSNGACQGTQIDCPRIMGNTYCTVDQTNGPACSAAPGGRCNSC
ncbi:MAG: hypothetical protein ABI591_23975 [Kofleriaceae bacterium]